MAAHLTAEDEATTSTEEVVDGTITMFARGVFDGATVNALTSNGSGTFDVDYKISKPMTRTATFNGKIKFQLINPGPNTSVTISTTAVS